MKRIVGLFALFMYNTAAFAEIKNTNIDGIDVSGFECADESLQALPYLGRGDDFPNFLIADVNEELKRQQASSILVSIKCTGIPELKAATSDTTGKDSKKLLSTLSMTFPLDLEIKNGTDVTKLTVAINYFVEHLDTSTANTVTKNFIVKN